MSRSIIQIATSEAGAENGYSRHLIALAADGTLWERVVTRPDVAQEWKQIEPLPENVLFDNNSF
jgi:hypothetical protein